MRARWLLALLASALPAAALAQLRLASGSLVRLRSEARPALPSQLEATLTGLAPSSSAALRVQLPNNASPLHRVLALRDGGFVAVSVVPAAVHWFRADGTRASTARLPGATAMNGVLSVGPDGMVLLRQDTGELLWAAPGEPEGSVRRVLRVSEFWNSTGTTHAALRSDGTAQLLVPRIGSPPDVVYARVDPLGRVLEQRALGEALLVAAEDPVPDGCWWLVTSSALSRRSRLYCLGPSGLGPSVTFNALPRSLVPLVGGRVAMLFEERVVVVDASGRRAFELVGIRERTSLVALADGGLGVLAPALLSTGVSGRAPLVLARYDAEGRPREEPTVLSMTEVDTADGLFSDAQSRVLALFNGRTLLSVGDAEVPGWSLDLRGSRMSLRPVALANGALLVHAGVDLVRLDLTAASAAPAPSDAGTGG